MFIYSVNIGLFKKQSKQGVDDMEFPGVYMLLKNEHMEIQGVNYHSLDSPLLNFDYLPQRRRNLKN